MNNDLIQKSVRLPADLVAYIESQEGRDFSKKLVNLLTDVREGDAERRVMLEKYIIDLESKRKRLNDLRSRIYAASDILRKLGNVLPEAEAFIADLEQDET